MTTTITDSTRAALLLASPLIAGGGSPTDARRLSARDLTRVELALQGIGESIGELQSRRGKDIIERLVADGEFRPEFGERLRALLRRGFAMGAAVEAWLRAGIWIVSRYDDSYPRPLIERLGGGAPPLLFGYGDIELLEHGWLAIQGSRNASQAALDFAAEVGASAAEYGKVIVSGGARGIDRAGMNGSLTAGGIAIGVLAESLAKHARSAESRRFIGDGNLVLCTPYDPDARFTVGNAMARNKLIFALAEHSLIAAAEVGKGGTWTGATEELARRRQGSSATPVYVPSERGEPWATALRDFGALSWPGVASLVEADQTGEETLLHGDRRFDRTAPMQQLSLECASPVAAGAGTAA